MLKGLALRKRSRLSGALNELRQMNQRSLDNKKKIYGHLRNTGHKHSVNITTRETEVGRMGGAKMEKEGNFVRTMFIGMRHTTTTRDVAMLAIRTTIGQYAEDEDDLFTVNTNTAETWNDILKGHTIVNAREYLLPPTSGRQARGEDEHQRKRWQVLRANQRHCATHNLIDGISMARKARRSETEKGNPRTTATAEGSG